jgi:plasmid stability protein
MANTITMTVRIDRDLVAALKLRAERDGRSLSAEVVELLRAQVAPVPLPARARGKSTMGMFSHREFEDLELAAFKEHRRDFSARVHQGVAARGKRL